MVIGWGKPKIKTTRSVGGRPTGAWREIDTPKKGTTKLEPKEGDDVEALDEGEDVVAARSGKVTHTLEFELFVKKGMPRPFDDEDGVIKGEHAFCVIPEDEECEGILIERSKVRVAKRFSSEEGVMLRYVAKCLKPAEGKMVKEYFANGVQLDKYKLHFSDAQDTTGKEINVTATGTVTATTSTDWITTSVASKKVTVKVAANTTGEVRMGFVTIMADGKTSQVEVMQIPK